MIKRAEELRKDIKKKKIIALLAPSYVAEFDFRNFRARLRKLGFRKIVELTFGAKLVNREYHKLLGKSEGLIISSVCSGVVDFIQKNMPAYGENLAKIDSPMIATAKICKKIFPEYKLCFISPCNFKIIEAEKSGIIEYALDYQELKKILPEKFGKNNKLDMFYNEYTRIYPLSGGLSKTAKLRGVLKNGEEKVIDGITEVKKFLEKSEKRVKFLDCNFCAGGCIGGVYLSSKNIQEKREKVLEYLEAAKKETISKINLKRLKKIDKIKFVGQ